VAEATQTRRPEEETAPAVEPAVREAQAGTAARVLALQGAVGNRAVARMVAQRREPEPAPEVEEAAPEQTLQRSFFGKIWSGIKGAAKAVGGAIAGAAEWVWDGAKAAGQWAVDWVKKAGSHVVEAIKWFGKGAWDIIKVIGTYLWEKLSLLGTLAWDFIRFFPIRLWRLVIDGWQAISGMLHWLWKGVSGGASWGWVWDGFKSAMGWCLQTLIHAAELFGIADGLQLAWGLIFHTRPLKKEERDASIEVHGKGLVPLAEVRVDQGSFLVKIGKWLNHFKDPGATERAVTTMHVIQAPTDFPIEIAVHELTHVVQYEKVGANYMPQALHGQGTKEGYDYGDLAQARKDGKHYRDFNREQQAQIAEDYYVVLHGGTARYHGTKETLLPFVEEMKAGAF
jgi:hypothetical protein